MVRVSNDIQPMGGEKIWESDWFTMCCHTSDRDAQAPNTKYV